MCLLKGEEEEEELAGGRSASPSARIAVTRRLYGRKSAGGEAGQAEKGGDAEAEESRNKMGA